MRTCPLFMKGKGVVWAVWLVDVGMKSCFEWGLLSGVIVKLRSLSNQGFHATRRDLAEVPFFLVAWLGFVVFFVLFRPEVE